MGTIEFMVTWYLQGIPFIFRMAFPPMSDGLARQHALHHCRQAVELRLANLRAAGYPLEDIAVTRVDRVGDDAMADITPRRAAEIIADLTDRKRQRGLPCFDEIDPYTRAGMFVRPLGQWSFDPA